MTKKKPKEELRHLVGGVKEAQDIDKAVRENTSEDRRQAVVEAIKELTTEKNPDKLIGDNGLRPEWIKFIDQYMVDFNGARAYKAMADIRSGKDMTLKVASVGATRLLKTSSVRQEIRARLSAQRMTKPNIVAGLARLCLMYDVDPNPYTGAVANKAYETLAKIGGYIQNDTQVQNFFEGNVAIFQPVATESDNKEFERLLEAKGRLVE